jgi:hypothetical protein
MALLTKDPFMLRRAGWLFALAVPAALYLAYDAREDEPGFAALTAILAPVSGLISAWSFSRRSNASDGESMEAEKKNHKAVLAVASGRLGRLRHLLRAATGQHARLPCFAGSRSDISGCCFVPVAT